MKGSVSSMVVRTIKEASVRSKRLSAQPVQFGLVETKLNDSEVLPVGEGQCNV